MRTNTLRVLAMAIALPGYLLGARAEEAPERLVPSMMPAATPSRAFVADLAPAHIADGRVHIVDAMSGAYLGQVTTGYLGQFTLSPDRKELLVNALYYSRLDKGERADVLQIYDLESLKLKDEIVLNAKRAQSLPYRGIMHTSVNGARVYIQNATPATSVTVVDLASRKVLSEIPTPGCWAIFPGPEGAQQFSTLCGDGAMLTIVMDAQGKPVSQKRSQKFFDPDEDALFIHGERIGSDYYFLSFKGVLHQISLGAATPAITGKWPLLASVDKKNAWRPGGYAPFAIHPGTGSLYVLAHAGGKEGTHKNPAKEIWEFDLASKKLLRRQRAHGEVAIAITHSGPPLLVGVDPEKAAIHTYDAASLKLKNSMTPVGDMPMRLEMQ